jgi:hypothetical protein
MELYRFSPIKTKEHFRAAIEYVATRCGDLALEITGEKLPVTIVKLFAHYPDEYEALEAWVREHGKRADVSSRNSFYVDVASGLTVAGQKITLLGVRKPDPYRMQVGCGDYEVTDLAGLTERAAALQPEYVRSVENAHALGMTELWHPDFDVLGYVIAAQK